MVEQFTATERDELNRIQRRFRDTGDIRLKLMYGAAVRWTDRWDIAKCFGVALTTVGEGMCLVGKIRGDNRLSNVGEFSRNLGLVTTVVSWMGANLSDFDARDIQIERVWREMSRRRR